MSAPFSFGLAWSPVLRGLVAVLHGLPLICALAAGLDPAMILLLLAASGVSAVRQLRRARADAARRLSFAPGACLLEDGGRCEEIEIDEAFADLGWLISFAWRSAGSGRGRGLVVRDGFSAAEWRQIRFFLRWRRMAGEAAKGGPD